MKKIITAALLSMTLTVSVLFGVTADTIEVEFTDSSMGLSLYPFMQNGVLMIPLREMAENLNYLVEWDDTEKAAKLLKINSEAEIYLNSEKSIINGEEFLLPCETRIINGSMYCPLIFIKELSGLPFSWDYAGKTLTVLANSAEFNAFGFAKEKVKKRVVIKNPFNPSKFASVEAAHAYACYPSAEDAYITDECVVQECKSAGNGAWGYAKYDTKELKDVLSNIKTSCEIRFWAKTNSAEGNSVYFTVKSGGPNIAYSFDIDTEWKEYSVVLDWNAQIDISSAYALIGMKRYSAGDKVYIDGLSINPAE